MKIQIGNKLDFVQSINFKHVEKVNHCTEMLSISRNMIVDNPNSDMAYVCATTISEYESHIRSYNKIYSFLLKNIDLFFDFIENSEVLKHIILEEDLNEKTKLNLVEEHDYYSSLISFHLCNHQNIVIARIDIRIESIIENPFSLQEQNLSEYIDFEISKFDDGNTYEYTFFRNAINTDEHVKQFKQLQNYIFQSNFFIYSMKDIHDHHIYEKIYFLTHSSFNKMSDFENILYGTGSVNGINPSFEWNFIDTLTNMIKRTSNIKNFNNQDIKYFLKVIRTINKLLEKTNIKHEYTLFSTETITSQYHLYVDRQKEIDICFDVDLNCNIKNIVNLKLYKDNYNRERIETNFTLSDYFYHKDEVIQNMEMLSY